MKRWECTVCGYIHEGEQPPDECPVCSADKSLFVEVVEETTAHAAPSRPEDKPTLVRRVYAMALALTVKHHLHPIMVHTPNGIVPMALVFLLIAAGFGLPLFESAAFYSLVFVLIAMPLVVFTGYVMWQQRYRGALTTRFKVKICASIVTITLLCTLIVWRIVQPDIVTIASTGRWIFLGLSCLLVGAVGIAGHIGGKLVFGNRKG